MGKAPLSDVDSWILVLATISKLSGRGGRLTVEATTDRIQRTLKEIYGRDLTKREVEYIIQNLENRGFIFKKKGLLRNGRAVLYGIKPSKTTQEAFNLIKIDPPKRAYIHNGYEGLVYDPPSTEVALPKTNSTWALLNWGIICLSVFVPLLLRPAVDYMLECKYKQVAERLAVTLRTWAMGAKKVSAELARLESTNYLCSA